MNSIPKIMPIPVTEQDKKDAAEVRQILAKALAVPLQVMSVLGAYPLLIIGETEGGGLAIIPTRETPPENVIKAIEAILASLKDRGGVEIVSIPSVTGRDECPCQGCTDRRAKAADPAGPRPPKEPDVMLVPPPAPPQKPILSPTKGGIN